MTCMTTKQKFDVEDPEVVLLNNQRYAYRVECPWEGKNGKKLVAFKFCSRKAFEDYQAKTGGNLENPQTEAAESEHISDVEEI